MKHRAFLLTGSNVGDSKANLANAIQFLQKRVGEIIGRSAIYKTEPWGNKDQAAFLNQVIEVETPLSPEELMSTLLAIESEMGRVRVNKWEPRIIDIDILFYDDLILNDGLHIPHPLLQERRFALVPLAEIAPELIHPGLLKNMIQLLRECPDKGEVLPL